ncbi:aminotransferase class IV [Halocalculus aciditolerans]|uniref:4-amino-4-deoxychorismate lyase n=1 Tax=Halocalculus aciditolerans TaxID=1383812 RepID=A0A830FN36_9EURY|nr:aminotransferase class IV [Halocalculus aciditolerans]GGL63244.1 4-amino-4-deoxychorismate lyase [Halocalculus aciditolerans]
MFVHLNGDLVPDAEAAIPVSDRGFRYGDAGFETLRAYGGELFRWDAHESRLRGTLDALGMPDALPGDLRDRVRETLDANDLADAYVRVSVTRGPQAGKLAPGPAEHPTVVVVTKPLPRGGRESDSVWDAPARVETVPTRRVPDSAIPADAKTHNYLNGVLAKRDLSPDADAALMLDVDGNVAECATSNVFFARDGVLHTPTTDGDVLPGITRDTVLDLAADRGIPVETGRYGPEALRDADELFLTNTTWELRPVSALDGRGYPVGDLAETLADAYDDHVETAHY